jgi:hypothetical protein
MAHYLSRYSMAFPERRPPRSLLFSFPDWALDSGRNCQTSGLIARTVVCDEEYTEPEH